jgi:hypothetical protein
MAINELIEVVCAIAVTLSILIGICLIKFMFLFLSPSRKPFTKVDLRRSCSSSQDNNEKKSRKIREQKSNSINSTAPRKVLVEMRNHERELSNESRTSRKVMDQRICMAHENSRVAEYNQKRSIQRPSSESQLFNFQRSDTQLLGVSNPRSRTGNVQSEKPPMHRPSSEPQIVNFQRSNIRLSKASKPLSRTGNVRSIKPLMQRPSSESRLANFQSSNEIQRSRPSRLRRSRTEDVQSSTIYKCRQERSMQNFNSGPEQVHLQYFHGMQPTKPHNQVVNVPSGRHYDKDDTSSRNLRKFNKHECRTLIAQSNWFIKDSRGEYGYAQPLKKTKAQPSIKREYGRYVVADSRHQTLNNRSLVKYDNTNSSAQASNNNYQVSHRGKCFDQEFIRVIKEPLYNSEPRIMSETNRPRQVYTHRSHSSRNILYPAAREVKIVEHVNQAQPHVRTLPRSRTQPHVRHTKSYNTERGVWVGHVF